VLHLAGDDEKVGRVARKAVNCWDYHYVAVGDGGQRFSKLWPVGDRAGDLSRGIPFRILPPSVGQAGW
jgi:hypothetical protein